MCSDELPVLIAGAGPAGLVAALSLLKNGVKVRVIAKEHEHRLGQRGAGIQPRTLEYYNLLGVLPDVLAHSIPVMPMRMYKLPGGVEPLKTFDLAPRQDPVPSIPYALPVLLGQENAETILRAHLAKYGCFVELATELQSFEQFPDHVVAHIIKTNSIAENAETVRCRWLIGADGAKGVVRKQLGLAFQGETRDTEHLLVGDIHVKGLKGNYLHMWGDFATKAVSLRPTESEDDNFMLVAGGREQGDVQKLINDREAFLKFIHDVTNRTDIEFGEFSWVSDYRANIRMVDKFGVGRVFLAGNAAHVHSPSGGQGMNSSVQDAVNLTWKLALVEKGIAAQSLLDTYSEERVPVIAEMLEQTTKLLNKTMSVKRDADDTSAWDRRGALLQLGVNYRWSSIVVDERISPTSGGTINPSDAYGEVGGQIRSGDRAPDAPALVYANDVDKSTSLFQIYGASYHTVLLFTADVDVITPALDTLTEYPAGTTRCVVILSAGTCPIPAVSGVEYVLLDKEGHAYMGYAVPAGTSTIVIVRPDGVIGGIVLAVEGLRRYFKGVLSI